MTGGRLLKAPCLNIEYGRGSAGWIGIRIERLSREGIQ